VSLPLAAIAFVRCLKVPLAPYHLGVNHTLSAMSQLAGHRRVPGLYKAVT
jgi:hypothetical protein